MNESLKSRYQRPEGALIESALAGPPKRSRRTLADQVGLSEGRVRQIVNGYRTEAGTVLEIQAPADTLARIAVELGITAHQMRVAGRDDVADMLDRKPNVGVTEEGDLWLTSLDDEKEALREWLASEQEKGPPEQSLALWTTEQLLDAAKRSHADEMRLNGYIINMLNNRKPKEGGDDGTQASTQKNELDERRTLNEQEVSDEDESVPVAADDLIDEDEEGPGERIDRE